MIYLKKDGSIKKSYVQPCKLLINATKKHYEITYGRNDTIINEYDAYNITFDYYTSNKINKDYAKKISDICNTYGYSTRLWYSAYRISELQIDINDLEINNLKSDLSSLLTKIKD